jgi:hypothetical protein
MAGEQPVYLSYLLRLWRTSDDGEQIWRVSLESPGTGERKGFANLKALYEFLAAQTGQVLPPDQQSRTPDTPDNKGGEKLTSC